jgi:hypothetical protein
MFPPVGIPPVVCITIVRSFPSFAPLIASPAPLGDEMRVQGHGARIGEPASRPRLPFCSEPSRPNGTDRRGVTLGYSPPLPPPHGLCVPRSVRTIDGVGVGVVRTTSHCLSCGHWNKIYPLSNVGVCLPTFVSSSILTLLFGFQESPLPPPHPSLPPF